MSGPDREGMPEGAAGDSELVDSLPVGVYHTSEAGRILRANPEMAAMFGYDHPDEMLDVRAADLYVHPEDAAELRRELEETDVVSQRTREMRRLDGTRIWVEESVRAIRDPRGGLVGLRGILQDVTDARKARRDLTRSEAMHRSLFQNAGDALFVMEGERFIDCNKATERIFGVDRETVLNARPWELSPPAQPSGGSSRELAMQRIRAALEGRPQFFTWTHRRGDGTDFPAEVSLVRVELGDRTLVQARVHDITRRQQVLDELSARERVLEAVSVASTLFLSSIPWRDSIEEVLDRIARATDSAAAMLLVGNGDAGPVFVSPGAPPAAREMVRALEESPDPGPAAKLARRDGPFSGTCERLPKGLSDLLEECCESCLAMPVKVAGRPWGCLLLTSSRSGAFPHPVVDACAIAARLVSAAVSAERFRNRLATEKEKLEVTLSAIEDAVITTDFSGNVLFFNLAAEDLTDIPLRTATGKSMLDCMTLLERDSRERLSWQRIARLGTGSLEEAYPRTIECTFSQGSEHTRSMRLSVRCLSGPSEGFVIILRDTTWERRLAEEKASAQRLESLGVLAGGIAHDFNNFLTAILSGLELSKLHSDPDSNREILGEVERAAVSARGLTRQLLTFSRGGAPVARPMRITDMIRDTAGFVLSGTNCEMRFRAEDGLWPVQADEAQISQVVNNLVLNSRQAMPSGGTISIRLGNQRVNGEGDFPLSAGNYVRIEIEDQGTGIPENMLPRIFDPYFTTKGEGSGLGLATTHSIVARHGGHIDVASTPGRGTCFTILLPAADSKPQEKVGTPPESPLEGRVLLMDDDRSVLTTASQLIEAMGCAVEKATEGREAIEAYEAALEGGSPFDAVIMDLTVQGGMGGAAAASEIVKMDPTARLVVSSGYSNDPVMSDYADYGFVDCIAKPYTMKELHALLSRVLTPGGD